MGLPPKHRGGPDPGEARHLRSSGHSKRGGLHLTWAFTILPSQVDPTSPPTYEELAEGRFRWCLDRGPAHWGTISDRHASHHGVRHVDVDQHHQPRRTVRCFALACLLLVVLARAGSAQVNSDSVKHRNECRLAEQVMTTGRPEPHREWARGYIAFCGHRSRARAASTALMRLRTSEDRRILEKEWGRVRLLRDSTLFETAMEIAADGRSSLPARVYAMRYLLNVVHPDRLITYDLMVREMVRGNRRGPCFERTAAGRQAEYHGVPQPGDFRERITALMRRIHSDPVQPAQVRRAALCL